MSASIQLVSTLQTARLKNSFCCEVPQTNLNSNILKVFRKHNLIYGVQGSALKNIIFLRYFRGKPTINKLKLTSIASKKLYVSKSKLYRLTQTNPALFFILSTSRGIVGLPSPTRPKSKSIAQLGELLCFGW